MEYVGEKLECPVCQDRPRPGMPGVGLCPVGHYICYNCTVALKKTFYDGCPSCRAKPVNVHLGHHFIMSVVKMYTDQQVFQCSFPKCTATARGPNILYHEKTCVEKPIPCPKINCHFQGPISVYLNHEHGGCFISVDMSQTIENAWSFTIPFYEFFNVDNNTTESDTHFKLRLLSEPVGKTSKAYFAMANRYEDLVFRVGWLGDDAPHYKYSVYMTVKNPIGRIGGFHEGNFNDNRGLIVTKGRLVQWAFWQAGIAQCHVQIDIILNV